MSLPEPLAALLTAHHVLHLATVGEGGPHAAPVFFALHDEALVWISATTVLHSRHIGAGAAVAASLGPSTPSLGLIEGLQLRGLADCPEQGPLRGAWLARFPLAAPMVATAVDHRFYRLRLTWARLVRTVAGVSRNQEWSFAP